MVAIVSCVTYIIAGFVKNPVVSLVIGIILMMGTIMGIKYLNKSRIAE